MRENIIVAACVQAGTILFDNKRTLQKAAVLIDEAARKGAQVVLLPEAFIGGYPRGADFGTVVGARSPEGRDLYAQYYASAIDVPGSEVNALGEMAAKHGVQLVVGVIEREGLTLYCSVLFFDPKGRLAAKRRKLMPTGAERLIWGFGDGSTLPVLPTAAGKIGAVICWENYMPLLRTAITPRAYRSGARLLQMGDRPGYQRCSISRWRVGALSCPPTSSLADRTIRPTMTVNWRMTRTQSFLEAAPASSIHWAMCWPVRYGIRKALSPPNSISPRLFVADTTSIRSDTMRGPIYSN